MLEMIRRIFKIAGRSRQKIIVGITFNILKSFFNGFMMFGVFWILLHLENLTPTIILQAFGVVLGSVIGRFFFQWMYDRTMSGTGYDIFRDYRLEIGEKLKQAPMGYFSEQNLGTIQTILTTTIADLEGYSMLAIEQMTSGVAMAALMSIMMFFFNPRKLIFLRNLPAIRGHQFFAQLVAVFEMDIGAIASRVKPFPFCQGSVGKNDSAGIRFFFIYAVHNAGNDIITMKTLCI